MPLTLWLRRTGLNQDDVSIFNNIILPLGKNFPRGFDSRFIAELFQNFKVVYNTLNKCFLEIWRSWLVRMLRLSNLVALPPWITPAAWGALVPFLIVHWRTSSTPVVKKLPRFNICLIVTIIFGKADFVPSFLHSSSASASVSNLVSRSSKQIDNGMIGSPVACSLTHSAIFGRCLFFWRI